MPWQPIDGQLYSMEVHTSVVIVCKFDCLHKCTLLLCMQITTEKLDEHKGHIPRAGPKYRLGMYFETIHGVHHFDDVYTPSEDGYTSYWETDTEVDTDLGNFIFSNVKGDSASVLCIDEAVERIALRDKKERQEQMQRIEASRVSPKGQQQEEDMLDQSNESKRSLSSRQSRRSHHSGSDGMYDEPPPLPPRRISIGVDTMAEEHTYETLDDCQDEYRDYLSKDSFGSPSSKDECDSDHSGKGANGKTTRLSLKFTKQRSTTTPVTTEGGLHYKNRIKYSDPATNELPTTQKKRRSDRVAPKGMYPPPVKGYSFPAGIPEEYTDYIVSPTGKRLHSTVRLSPDRNTQVTSPERRCQENQKTHCKAQRSPSLIIKHKGQTFLIPVVGKKLQQRLEKEKGPPKTPIYATVMKQSTPNTSIHRSPSDPQASIRSRCHISPPKTVETTEHIKSKGKRHMQSTAPKQVTHYGML